MLFRKIQNEVQSGQVMQRPNLSAWLYVTPLMLVLVPFFLLPTLVVLVASFFETDGFGGIVADVYAGELRRRAHIGADVPSVL